LIIGPALYYAANLSSLTAATIDLPEYGFLIDVTDVKPWANASTPLVMCLPASEGFAPNINVTIQPYPGSIKEYISLSKRQFSADDGVLPK
jgi:hypothetical protein